MRKSNQHDGTGADDRLDRGTRMSRRVVVPFPVQCNLTGLPEPIPEYRFAPPRRWRFDYCWPLLKLALEVDGGGWINGRHSRGAGIEKDAEKVNAAAALGYRVLRATPAMVADGRALRAIEGVLR